MLRWQRLCTVKRQVSRNFELRMHELRLAEKVVIKTFALPRKTHM